MSGSVTVTFLVDNSVMELIPDSDLVHRVSEPGRSFLAEHGFSILVETEDGRRVLLDAGATELVVPHNLDLLGLDIGCSVDAAVLSHGHSDHAGAISLLRCPIHAHPDVFGPRFLARNGEVRFELTVHQLPFARDRLVLSAEPVEVLPGIWTTGEIPRDNEWERPKGFLRVRGVSLEEDEIPDDQALVLVTPGGLVVIAGCAHAGIINTVNHARRITGVDAVRAVVGGFHLIDAGPEKLDNTIAALRDLDVDLIAPTHCTGFRATAALASAFGEKFVYATGGHAVTFA